MSVCQRCGGCIVWCVFIKMVFSLHYAFDSMPPTGKGRVSLRVHAACVCILDHSSSSSSSLAAFMCITNPLYIAMSVGYLGSHTHLG